MILSDNETNVDLLNNEAIAKTIVSLIENSKDQPISIGIHGDWGAGKSSILEMVESEIKKNKKERKIKTECIRFNGWRHQGFEDSKVALISSILSELNEKEKLGPKATEILKKLWKNVNWMTVAKTAGKTALGFATGTAPIAILSSALDVLKTATTTEAGITGALDSIEGYLKEAKITEDTSSNTEFVEFRKNFEKLLDDAKIDKLVVLIDDLDRCLPDVTIETLEAVRLFMFTGKTAFVIAADESMIRYAVKKHFPDAVDENRFNTSYTFANKYLEKLIQVPFRIPALGEVEACIYIMLLMVGSSLPTENKDYLDLCNEGLDRIRKPWNVKKFSVDDVRKILKTDYDKVAEQVMIATQISHLLAKNTDGNPRKIKRFINMLILRYKIAVNRGFGEDLEMKILAKMMLAENYWPDFYKGLPSHLNDEGKWIELPEILADLSKKIEEKESVRGKDPWFNLNEILEWLISEPQINDIDLRPYYYASKEKTDYFFGKAESNDLSEIVDLLFTDALVITGRIDDLNKLSAQASEQVLDVVAQKILENGQFETKPNGIDGLTILVKQKPALQQKLVTFIDSIPIAKVGVWILQGWDKCIPINCDARKTLNKYFNKIEVDGNPIVQAALRNLKGK